MKILAKPINNTTNFNGEVFEGRVDPTKLSSVIDLLIRNYNSAELATLREWVSNAYDSHKEAGQTRPIEVTLPSRFTNNLIVEDFGIGMSYEDVKDIYVSFLSSTKNTNNRSIGGFGIGGKSALAIADQYTMVAIKDGLKNVFLLERSDDGGLSIKTPVYNQPTDEHSGVKVTVAASKNWNFSEKDITRVLEGFRAEDVTITNGSFTSFYTDATLFKHGILGASVLSNSNDRPRYGSPENARVFVGAVAYPIPRQVLTKLRESSKFTKFGSASHWDFAIFVKVGTVSFPSSREVIESTDANVTTIFEAFKKFYQEVEAHINAKVAAFKDIHEAYAFATSPFAMESNMDVTYKGQQLIRVKYKGFKSFQIQQESMASVDTAVKIYESQELERPCTTVDLVVLVNEEEAELSSETYRKYIRSAAVDLYLDRLKNGTLQHADYRAGRGRKLTILLTTTPHPLYEVTSEVMEFTELRKKPVLKSTGGNKRITDTEAKSRVDRETIRCFPSDARADRIVPFGVFYNEEAKQIILPQDEDALTTAAFLGELFGINSRICIVKNKLAVQTIRRAYPALLTLEEFIATLPRAEITAATKRVKEIKHLMEYTGLEAGTTSWLQDPAVAKQLNENAAKIFRPDLMSGVETFRKSINRNRWNQKAPTKSYEIMLTLFGKGLLTPNYASPKGLFSLMRSYNQEANSKEILEYINWTADRYFAAKS